MSRSSKKSGKDKKGAAPMKAEAASPVAVRGAMLITIGPQCCGKTTFLSGLGEPIQSFEIDNAPQVYQKIPVSFCVSLLEPKTALEKPAPFSDKKAYGKSTIQRVLENKETEQMILASLFSGAINWQAAESRLITIGSHKDFVGAVKAHLDSNSTFSSSTIDLFIPEAISFGIEQYKMQLESAAKNCNGCFASGNTNLNVSDYKDALAIAATQKRRVRFIRWGIELPSTPLSELFHRSVGRLLKSGRYVPSSLIVLDVDQANAIMESGSTHDALADTAGYLMSTEGYVYTAESDMATLIPVTTQDTKWGPWFSGDELVYNIQLDGAGRSAPVANLAAPLPAVEVAAPKLPVSAPSSSSSAKNAVETLKAATKTINEDLSSVRPPASAPASAPEPHIFGAAPTVPPVAPVPTPAPAPVLVEVTAPAKKGDLPAIAPVHKNANPECDSRAHPVAPSAHVGPRSETTPASTNSSNPFACLFCGL